MYTSALHDLAEQTHSVDVARFVAICHIFVPKRLIRCKEQTAAVSIKMRKNVSELPLSYYH